VRHFGFGRGFGRFNETRMYGRGRGLAEEAAHELELVHRNDPEFGNASAQGRADLSPARLCFRVDLEANPRTLGGVRSRREQGGGL
jgi:hypothetical protein